MPGFSLIIHGLVDDSLGYQNYNLVTYYLKQENQKMKEAYT